MASIRDPSDGQRGNRIGELEGESDKMSKIQNRVGPVTSIFSQAKLDPVVSALKVGIYPKARKFANPKGPEERLNKMRKTVTALIKYERIELNFHRAHEARAYAERVFTLLFIL